MSEPEEITPRSIDRAAFGLPPGAQWRRLVDDDGDGYGGREARHPGDCPSTLSYGHDTHTPGCIEYTPVDARLRVCGHVDPRDCDLSCRVLAIEATNEGSVGRLRALIDAEIRARTAPLDQRAVEMEDENADLRMMLNAAQAELARIRHAIEDFILWWDMPPFALDDDERLRAEVDALRAALAGDARARK